MTDPARTPLWRRRFLDQATTAQKLLLAVGGIATAILAIGALVLAVGDRLDNDDDSADSPSGGLPSLVSLDGETIESRTEEGDALITGLLAVAEREPRTVHLGVKVLADDSQPALNSADIWVYFNCSPGSCGKARLQFPRNDAVVTNPLGFDLTGWWEVALARGVDYQSAELDIVLVRTAALES